MYCPKCGKQVPDNAAFCSSCGADLRNDITKQEISNNDNAKSRNGWVICIVVSAVVLLWTFSAYSRSASPYLNAYGYHSSSSGAISIVIMSLLSLGGLATGILGLYYQGKPTSNPYRSTQESASTVKRGVKVTAQKLAIEGQDEFVKCSRCGMVQKAERTSCQVCGAKFINRKPR